MLELNQCYGCFWWESGACDGEATPCEKMLGATDPRYRDLYEEYDADCQEALEVVTDKWSRIFHSEEFNEL